MKRVLILALLSFLLISCAEPSQKSEGLPPNPPMPGMPDGIGAAVGGAAYANPEGKFYIIPLEFNLGSESQDIKAWVEEQDLIYKYGYFWTKGKWKRFTYKGEPIKNTIWLKSAAIRKPIDINTFEEGAHFVLAYGCNKVRNGWDCNGNKWMLRKFAVRSKEGLPKLPTTPTLACEDECSMKTKQCAGNGYQICGNYDEDSCTEWSIVYGCPVDTVCEKGECELREPEDVQEEQEENLYSGDYLRENPFSSENLLISVVVSKDRWLFSDMFPRGTTIDVRFRMEPQQPVIHFVDRNGQRVLSKHLTFNSDEGQTMTRINTSQLEDGEYTVDFDFVAEGKLKSVTNVATITVFTPEPDDCVTYEDNGPSNEKINFIFVADKDVTLTTELVKAKIDHIFSYEPFKSNRQRFNVNFVSRSNDLKCHSFGKAISPERVTSCNGGRILALASSCTFDLKKDFILTLQSRKHAGSSNKLGGVSSDETLAVMGGGWWVTLHELAHDFGDFVDEYVEPSMFGEVHEGYVRKICDRYDAQTNVACPKWCSGPARSVNDLLAECPQDPTCEQNGVCKPIYTIVPSEGEIQEGYMVNPPADAQFSRCENPVSKCIPQTSEQDCRSNNCYWLQNEHEYFQSRCVPVGTENVNIGTGCRPNTGCYTYCTVYNRFKPQHSKNSFMSAAPASQKFNSVQEEILCQRIKDLTGSVGGYCTTQFGMT